MGLDPLADSAKQRVLVVHRSQCSQQLFTLNRSLTLVASPWEFPWGVMVKGSFWLNFHSDSGLTNGLRRQ